ncbi:MAG: hypothetical protein VCE91_18905, partial [Nitrospinota bacterium]
NFNSLRDYAVSKGGEVSFYADGEEDFSVLATAHFLRFIPNEDPESESIRSHHELYRLNPPDRMRRFVHLKNLKLADNGMRLDNLNGWLASGEALKLDGISREQPEASIYYIKNPNKPGIELSDQVRLSEAKCLELSDKYKATRELWDKDIDRVSRDHIIQLEEERNKQSGEKRTSSKKR